jgi:cysteine synthase B
LIFCALAVSESPLGSANSAESEEDTTPQFAAFKHRFSAASNATGKAGVLNYGRSARTVSGMVKSAVVPEQSRRSSQPAAPGQLSGEGLLSRVGNTPLFRLQRIGREFPGVQLLAKAEWYNPGGSVKDRAAFNIVRQALRSGKLEGKQLLDSTSGNTGIAYAMIGAAMGFGVTLCMPSNVSAERKHILNAYGASIVYTDPGEGSDGAIRKARALAEAEPGRYYYADQYSNEANWRAHYETTANEIWEQTDGRVTHFLAMLGTSGTFVGTSRRLKELNPNVRCVSLQPDSPFHGIEGAKHMASSIVPAIYDPGIADENLPISSEQSYAMVKRLARQEGMLVGISGGAAIVGSLEVARRLAPSEQAVIVTVFPDNGDKYLSERFWDEED